MTQPFWRWTGWLSLGLAGCLHGPFQKTQVRVGPHGRDRSRQIVPVSEQRAYARLVAAASPACVPATDATSQPDPQESYGTATFQVAIPGPNMGSARSKTGECPTCSRDECPTEFIPVAVPAAEIPVTDMAPESPPMKITPYQPPAAWVAEEPRPFTAKTTPIPILQSAPVRTSGKPTLDDDFFPDDHEASVKSPVRQASNQNPADTPLDRPEEQLLAAERRATIAEESTEPRRITKQESPDVAKELPDTLTDGPAAQPRDVALLVDQVFEDLRQRRMADARQRTEWLKQLVARRSVQPEIAEPRMLDDIEAATPIEPAEVEDFFDEKDLKSE